MLRSLIRDCTPLAISTTKTKRECYSRAFDFLWLNYLCHDFFFPIYRLKQNQPLLQEHSSLNRKLRDLSSDSSQYSFSIDWWKALTSSFSRQENWSKKMLFHIVKQSRSLASTSDLLISTSVQKLTLGLKLRNRILKGKVCHYLGKGLLTLAMGPSVTLSFGNCGYSSSISIRFQERSPRTYFWLLCTKC